MKIAHISNSADGSIKYALDSHRGVIEALYFEYTGHFDGVGGKCATICLSVQSGCPLRCTFCSTALLDFKGNLSGEEMFDEVQSIQAHLRAIDRTPASSYALMGMGEPLLNYDGIIQFYRIVRSRQPEVAPISISTVGIPERIRKLTTEVDINFKLFLSINSPFQEQRELIMPDLKNYPLKASIEAASEYAASRNRKAEASYLLLRDVNDAPKYIHATALLLNPELFDAQVLLYNEGHGIGYERPADEVAERAAAIFRQHGLLTTIQVSKGRDISGACGQLARITAGDSSSTTQQDVKL